VTGGLGVNLTGDEQGAVMRAAVMDSGAAVRLVLDLGWDLNHHVVEGQFPILT
jgi:hypothetical protein